MMAAGYHWISRESAARMTTGMMNTHPSGAKRIFGISLDSRVVNVTPVRWTVAGYRLLTKRPPNIGGLFSGDQRVESGVSHLVRADTLGHLVLQVEFSLLQRLLFDFLIRRDLVFR